MGFAVIVVSYNAGEKLAATLRSILAQEDVKLRVIVKDGGSTDGSYDHARVIFAQESRICWIQGRDAGIYDAMNQALEALFEAGSPSGEWVYFLNCGDLLHDAQVLCQVQRRMVNIQEPGAADLGETPRIYYGDIIEMGSGQRVAANPRMDAFACFRNVPCHQACFYDASLMREERFDKSWRVRADYEHFLRCVFLRQASPRAMGIVICDYEGGGFSESEEGRRISAREHKEITEKYYTRGAIVKYRLYLWLSLQPLREKLAHSSLTAGAYHKLRNLILHN